MTKGEGGLLLAVVFLFSMICVMGCLNWQQKKNTELKYREIQKEIIILKEKNQSQDDLISTVIRTQAMAGMFDKDKDVNK